MQELAEHVEKAIIDISITFIMFCSSCAWCKIIFKAHRLDFVLGKTYSKKIIKFIGDNIIIFNIFIF